MREVLFLAHRIPYPPDRGDKIRSHHILRAIASHAAVHVGTLADDEFDLAAEPYLANTVDSHCLVRRTMPLPLAGLLALAKGQPVSLPAFRHDALMDYVRTVVKTRPIAAIYVFSGQMGQYIPADYTGRVVMDLGDVDSAKFDAYGETGRGPMGWINAREGRLLRAEEARLARRADVTLLISDEEAALFRNRLSADDLAASDIRVLGNGIDSLHFDPGSVAPEPRMLECEGQRLIFTGQMDYAPNIAAATRVIERILPLVRQTIPDATFHVVGRNPPAELAARDGKGGCRIWGRVEDMRTWLKASDLAIVPLDIARGVQNKVLEAMAMALPVVLTSGAATGIPAHDGEDFRIADSDEDLAAAVLALLRDRRGAQAMGQSARRFVMENANWQAKLAGLPALLDLPPRQTRHAA